MREIKFRAWDKLNQKMCLVQKIRFSENKVSVLLPKCKTYHSNTWLELMQYTGFKDGNGIEIYEGDFLSKTYGTLGDDETETVLRSVIWDKKYACFILSDAHVAFAFKVDGCVVIGNIYENPDLLKNICLKTRSNKMTNDDKQELIYYCRKGISFNSIRKLVDCADSTIKRYIEVFGKKDDDK